MSHADVMSHALALSVEAQPRSQPQASEMDFDISRTFSLLTAMTVLPVLLSLSVVSFATGAII
jgi:hypothetical protein